jgi:hypothetical protein
MKSIGGVSNAAHAAVSKAPAPPKASAAAAKAVVRDTDGDYDGTKLGQFDVKDMGKGQIVNRRA